MAVRKSSFGTGNVLLCVAVEGPPATQREAFGSIRRPWLPASSFPSGPRDGRFPGKVPQGHRRKASGQQAAAEEPLVHFLLCCCPSGSFFLPPSGLHRAADGRTLAVSVRGMVAIIAMASPYKNG